VDLIGGIVAKGKSDLVFSRLQVFNGKDRPVGQIQRIAGIGRKRLLAQGIAPNGRGGERRNQEE